MAILRQLMRQDSEVSPKLFDFRPHRLECCPLRAKTLQGNFFRGSQSIVCVKKAPAGLPAPNTREIRPSNPQTLRFDHKHSSAVAIRAAV
jgi:hypothetical protein